MLAQYGLVRTAIRTKEKLVCQQKPLYIQNHLVLAKASGWGIIKALVKEIPDMVLCNWLGHHQ